MKPPKGKFLSGKRIVSAPVRGDRIVHELGYSCVQPWESAKFPKSVDACVDSTLAEPILTLYAVPTGVIESPNGCMADAKTPSSG
jgi:hypothetical protein